MGRPKLPETEGKRVPLNMRTTRELRDRIDLAARESGRSVAQEVEARLRMALEVGPLIETMTTDKPTMHLFRTIAIVLRSIRKQASEKGWTEIQAREALRAAFGLIAEINFWTGEETKGPPDGRKVHGAPPRQTTPAHDGYMTAESRMIYDSAWDECIMMDDFGDTIADRWTGSGKVHVAPAAPRVDPQPARSAEDIMLEVSAGDRAVANAKKKRAPRNKSDKS